MIGLRFSADGCALVDAVELARCTELPCAFCGARAYFGETDDGDAVVAHAGDACPVFAHLVAELRAVPKLERGAPAGLRLVDYAIACRDAVPAITCTGGTS